MHEGGCHCGAVRFRVTTSDRDAVECNCSRCSMLSYLHWIVAPDEFELLQGEDVLVLYEFNTRVAKHRFCRVCGVQSFYTPRSNPDLVSVNLRCLDGDVLSEFNLRSFDGLNWDQASLS